MSISHAGTTSVWTQGIQDLTDPMGTTFLWSTDNSVVGGGSGGGVFTNWKPGEPNDVTEQCMTLRGMDGFLWNDARCTYPKSYACQGPLEP